MNIANLETGQSSAPIVSSAVRKLGSSLTSQGGTPGNSLWGVPPGSSNPDPILDQKI